MRAIEPDRYRQVVAAAGLSLAAIVLTGAAVRLTQAGLGCDTVPGCSEERFVPEWEFHPWVEFGNRLISGVVSVLVGLAVLTAYRRRGRRPDLIWLAWGLVAGVAVQVLLGMVVVRVDLHPVLVGSHYLVSMGLLWNAVALWVRAGVDDSAPSERQAFSDGSASQRQALQARGAIRIDVVPLVGRGLVHHGRALVALAAAVLVSGTLVTGTGPHSGDSRAERLQFDLEAITRAHGVMVWCLALVAMLLALRLHRLEAGPSRLGRWLLAAVVGQGTIGYAQYALGLPPAMVEVHVLGSMVVWCTAIVVYLHLFERRPVPPGPTTPDGQSGPHDRDEVDRPHVNLGSDLDTIVV